MGGTIVLRSTCAMLTVVNASGAATARPLSRSKMVSVSVYAPDGAAVGMRSPYLSSSSVGSGHCVVG